MGTAPSGILKALATLRGREGPPRTGATLPRRGGPGTPPPLRPALPSEPAQDSERFVMVPVAQQKTYGFKQSKRTAQRP